MSLRFRATDVGELAAVKEFLLRIFGASPDAPFAQDEHLRWKYFERARSYVLQNGASFAAHACAWPFEVLTGAGDALRGVHPIDWVAGTDVPGGGALLLREMRRLESISCCIGGTDVAQKVIAQTGYRARGVMGYYSRPLRPWKQFLTHPRRNFKLPARLARNIGWSVKAGAAAPAHWTAAAIRPEDFPPELQPQATDSLFVCGRSPALFRYFLKCPVARYQLYVASQEGKDAGYFLLSFTPGQAHIADAWVLEPNAEWWKLLYRLAVSAAYADGTAAEITTASAIPAAQQALESAGFKRHSALSIMLFDPKKLLPAEVPIHFQMIDNDFSFLHAGTPNYWT